MYTKKHVSPFSQISSAPTPTTTAPLPTTPTTQGQHGCEMYSRMNTVRKHVFPFSNFLSPDTDNHRSSPDDDAHYSRSTWLNCTHTCIRSENTFFRSLKFSQPLRPRKPPLLSRRRLSLKVNMVVKWSQHTNTHTHTHVHGPKTCSLKFS